VKSLSLFRRRIPFFLTGVLGGLVISEYYIQISTLSQAVNILTDWTTTIFSLGMIVGMFTVARHHYGIILKKTPKVWYFSVWIMVLMFSTFFIGVVLSTVHPVYEWIYYYFTIWSGAINRVLPAIFLLSASYRAFRIRTVETTLFLIASLIIVITYMPVISLIAPEMKDIYGNWLVTIPNTGMVQGLTIGTSVGALCIGFRILLGKEKAFAAEIGGES
jgi:hypothetical protein